MKRYLLLLPLVVCLVACGSSSANAGPTSSPTPSSGPHHVGQAVSIPGWQIIIASARTATKIGLMEPALRSDTFLIVQVTLRNTSHASAPASDTSFYCLGIDGTKYALVAAGAPRIDGLVASGHAASGQVTYEVPARAHQFTMLYESDVGAILATWQLSA